MDKSVLQFSLGDLKYFQADVFFHYEERAAQDHLILSLALAHSDIDAFLLYWDVLQESTPTQPEEGKVSAQSGLVTGLKWFTYMYLVGVLNETLVLIEKKRNALDVTSWEFLYHFESLKILT